MEGSGGGATSVGASANAGGSSASSASSASASTSSAAAAVAGAAGSGAAGAAASDGAGGTGGAETTGSSSEVNNAGALNKAVEKREPPVLHTTVVDEEPSYFGASGGCYFVGCECKFFYGTNGRCTKCTHSNLYHCIKPRRIDIEARKAEEEQRRRVFFKRKEREAREAEEKRIADELANPPVVVVNNFPCDVEGCECMKFDPLVQAPANIPAVPMEEAVAQASAAVGAVVLPEMSTPRGTHTIPAGGAGSGGMSAAGSTGSIDTSFSITVVESSSASSVGGSAGGAAAAQVPMGTIPGGAAILTGIPIAVPAYPTGAAANLPRICRKCKHSEIYHIKKKKDPKAKGGASGSSARKGAPAKK